MVTHKNHDLGIVVECRLDPCQQTWKASHKKQFLAQDIFYSPQNMPKSHASRIPIFGWDLTNFYLLWGLLSATPKTPKPKNIPQTKLLEEEVETAGEQHGGGKECGDGRVRHRDAHLLLSTMAQS